MNYYNPYPYPAQYQLSQLRQPYPMQYPAQNQPQQQSGMVWVRNRFEAENYPVAPNTAIALWDMSGPYVHRKETDVSGRPVMKTFQLVEATEAPQQTNFQAGDFITRQEFQDFVDSLTAKKEVMGNE